MKKTGAIREVHCTYDPETKSGRPGAMRRVKGTLHWVSALSALPAEVRLYDTLLLDSGEEQTEEAGDDGLIGQLNPKSKEVLKECLVEPGLKNVTPGEKFQFMRKGYFCVDPDSKPDKLVFNRVVSLRDNWEKIMRDT